MRALARRKVETEVGLLPRKAKNMLDVRLIFRGSTFFTQRVSNAVTKSTNDAFYTNTKKWSLHKYSVLQKAWEHLTTAPR